MARRSTRSGGLNLGGSEPGRMKELMLIGALGVVIVGALVMTVMYAWSSDDKEQQNTAEIMFQCTKCNAKFAYDATKQTAEQAITHSGAARCQKCNEPACALPMTKCPECGEHFLSGATRYQHEVEMLDMAGKDSSSLGDCPPTVCPKCKTDFHKWMQQHRKRKSRDR